MQRNRGFRLVCRAWDIFGRKGVGCNHGYEYHKVVLELDISGKAHDQKELNGDRGTEYQWYWKIYQYQ